jgi:hypothetical protein
MRGGGQAIDADLQVNGGSKREIDPLVRHGAAICLAGFLSGMLAFVTVIMETFLVGIRAQLRFVENILGVTAVCLFGLFCVYASLVVIMRLLATLRDEIAKTLRRP